MKEAVLVFPHQLFENHPCITEESHVFLLEEPLMFTQYGFHKQKLVFHRASMKAYADLLSAQGNYVSYIDSAALKKTEDISTLLKSKNITKVSFCDVVDDWIHSRLTASLTAAGISYSIIETPLFLTSRSELDTFFLPLIQKNKKFLMRNFYEWQRKRLNILLEENGKPVGGKWSYDEDNRQKVPKGTALPEDPKPNDSLLVQEAKKYVEEHFGSNYGSPEKFFYPTTHQEAKEWLTSFLKDKLALFGPYEDAVTVEGSFLFHSILSPLINVGLLTPGYVIEQTLLYAKEYEVPLASLEGFIRQIIGWREYIRAVYVYLGRKERASNYFKATRRIPESFWRGTTSILPVDDTVKKVLDYAYSHHIPRLMIMGNFMNLCGFEPDDVYRWFMELYIDAYDWVMVPNVYSMALYADGGLITTKPYISGSAYIIKMSDYKKGEWSEIWDALFWNFVGTHFKSLSGEGRLGFIGITYQKMSEEKREMYAKKAHSFLESLN